MNFFANADNDDSAFDDEDWDDMAIAINPIANAHINTLRRRSRKAIERDYDDKFWNRDTYIRFPWPTEIVENRSEKYRDALEWAPKVLKDNRMPNVSRQSWNKTLGQVMQQPSRITNQRLQAALNRRSAFDMRRFLKDKKEVQDIEIPANSASDERSILMKHLLETHPQTLIKRKATTPWLDFSKLKR